MVYRIYLLAFIFLSSQKARAQLSSADSVFLNSIFVEPVYINTQSYPGNWLWYKPIDSLSELYDQINHSYPFPNTSFPTAYNNIQIISLQRDSLVNDAIRFFNQNEQSILFDSVNDPFIYLNFTLNSISGKASAFYDSSLLNNPKRAFLINNGSGDNALSRSIISLLDYHNLNCHVRKFLKQYGDVYIAGTANEDQRALHFNGKKLGRYYPSMPTYLHRYLNQQGNSMGYNKLIELIAWIKYLKTQYDEVIFLGLSTGGSEGLWASLMAEPTAALISSGYSVLSERDSLSKTVNDYFSPGIFERFTRDSVLIHLSKSSTRFLFTLPQNDNALAQNDIDHLITANYFKYLPNVKHFYNYSNHSFPPCSVIDSFIQNLYHIPQQAVAFSCSPINFSYVNPFDHMLEVKIIKPMNEFVELRCYNSIGQLMFQTRTDKLLNQIQTDTWPKGTYILQIVCEKGQAWSKKVVKA